MASSGSAATGVDLGARLDHGVGVEVVAGDVQRRPRVAAQVRRLGPAVGHRDADRRRRRRGGRRCSTAAAGRRASASSAPPGAASATNSRAVAGPWRSNPTVPSFRRRQPAPATASVRPASAAPAPAASTGVGTAERGGQEAAGERVTGAGRVDDGRRPACTGTRRRRPSAWRSSTGSGAVLDDEQRRRRRRRRSAASATLANTTSGPSSAEQRRRTRSTPNASTTATDDTSTLSRPPAAAHAADELERAGADRLGAQRVGRHVQPRDAVEPRRVDGAELLAAAPRSGSIVRSPSGLDEHDDRARAPGPLHPDVDADRRRATSTSGPPAASSPTRR